MKCRDLSKSYICDRIVNQMVNYLLQYSDFKSKNTTNDPKPLVEDNMIQIPYSYSN